MVVVTDNYKELSVTTDNSKELQGEGPHLVLQHMMEANQRLFLLLVLVVSLENTL